MRVVIFISIFFNILLYASSNTLIIDNKVKKYLTTAEIDYITTKKVIIASNEYDYEPMDFNIENQSIGYSIDLLNVLANSVGLKVQYHVNTWTGLLKDFEEEKIDLMHTIYKTKKRENSMSFSIPYLVGNNCFIIRKDEKHITDIKMLFGKRIAVSKGWEEEVVMNKYPQIKKVYIGSLKEKLEALSLGKVDAILNDENIANYYIKKYGFTNLKASNKVIKEDNTKIDRYYFATLKKNSILISILNKAYANMDVKELNYLQSKWFGYDKKESIFSIKEQKYLEQNSPIRTCILPNLSPVTNLENGKPQGIVSDILSELENKTDISFEYIQTKTFKESLETLIDKECDIIPTLEYSSNREDAYELTKPYMNIPYVAVGQSDKEFFSDISELNGKKISIIAHTSIIDNLKKKNPSIEFIKVKDIKDGFDLVEEQKVYAHLTLYPIAKFYISKYYSQKLKIIGRLIEPIKISVGVKKGDEVLLSIMQKAINATSKTKISNIVNTWTELKIEKVVNYDLLLKIFVGITLIIILGIWRFKLLKDTNKEISSINEELKKSQKEIIKQKEEFEAIFRYSKDGIAILDHETKFVDFNSAYLKMLGYKREELIEKSFLDIIDDTDKNDVKIIIKDGFERGYVNNFEKVYLGKDQKRISTNTTISLMPNKKTLLLTVKDVTSIKLLESQSKLASMGEMIGNIAHQWRQPLSIITTSATGMVIKAEYGTLDEKEIKEFSEQIVQQAEYLSKTIDDFRNFIKNDISYLRIGIKEALFNALSLTRDSLKSNYITLIENIDDDLKIDGNKNELAQAFINIINNAKDKLKEIEQSKQKRYIYVKTRKVDKDCLEIVIKDNGGGIDENIIHRVFEPYFTTKHQSIGTGLGLSMAEKIISLRHKGEVGVHNTVFEYEGKKYKGACFLIRLFSNDKI